MAGRVFFEGRRIMTKRRRLRPWVVWTIRIAQLLIATFVFYWALYLCCWLLNGFIEWLVRCMFSGINALLGIDPTIL